MSTEAKKSLRQSMKHRLASLSEEEVTRQSQRAQQRILSLPQYQTATRISVYLSMPKAEAQTDGIIRDAFARGKKVFVPYIHRPPPADGEMRKPRSVIEMLRLQSIGEYEELERDGWGIPSLPAEGVGERESAMGGVGLEGKGDEGLDLLVVPGVAFDKDMNRLGHGKGFYDEYLTRSCAERRKPFLVGLCLAEQYLHDQDESIPTSDRDWRMDAIAIGDGTLKASEMS